MISGHDNHIEAVEALLALGAASVELLRLAGDPQTVVHALRDVLGGRACRVWHSLLKVCENCRRIP